MASQNSSHSTRITYLGIKYFCYYWHYYRYQTLLTPRKDYYLPGVLNAEKLSSKVIFMQFSYKLNSLFTIQKLSNYWASVNNDRLLYLEIKDLANLKVFRELCSFVMVIPMDKMMVSLSTTLWCGFVCSISFVNCNFSNCYYCSVVDIKNLFVLLILLLLLLFLVISLCTAVWSNKVLTW